MLYQVTRFICQE